MTVPHAAGALYSTTGDLHRWTRALFTGRVVSSESLSKMTTPNLGNYAFGLSVRDVDGRRLIAHGGGINGFNTFLAYYPAAEITVVVLANINGNTPQQIATALAAVAFGGSVKGFGADAEVTGTDAEGFGTNAEGFEPLGVQPARLDARSSAKWGPAATSGCDTIKPPHAHAPA